MTVDTGIAERLIEVLRSATGTPDLKYERRPEPMRGGFWAELCAAVAADDPGHRAAIGEQARLIVSDAEREVAQPADLDFTHAEAESVLRAVTRPRPAPPG